MKKASGRDGIPNMFYIKVSQSTIEGLYRPFKEIWLEGKVPSEWNESSVSLLDSGGHE